MRFAKLRRCLTACSFALGALAIVRPVWAECGSNLCEIDVDPAIVTPAQGACGNVEATLPDGCDCGITVRLGNVCSADIVAVDFSFSICDNPNPSPDHNCTTVEPKGTGYIDDAKAYSLGPIEKTFTLQTERGEETITVRGNVTEFRNSCWCSVPGGASGSESTSTLLAAQVLVGCALVRRWRRRPGTE
jgi:hypothetical protein